MRCWRPLSHSDGMSPFRPHGRWISCSFSSSNPTALFIFCVYRDMEKTERRSYVECSRLRFKSTTYATIRRSVAVARSDTLLGSGCKRAID
jgi:hypothetical protein